ncbi:LysR family transcriptional regulator [Streptomyces sp. NPDC057654]|uniref:LysR family transcriptional regulator n=1 Tax=Streptomyces sp. NPDC057654 TaxID=3346196 RepID=UPI00367F3E2D
MASTAPPCCCDSGIASPDEMTSRCYCGQRAGFPQFQRGNEMVRTHFVRAHCVGKEKADADWGEIDTVMGMDTSAGYGPAGGGEDSGTGSSREPSVHQLRLFVVLAEELHFGNAAQRMFISQPAFSRQIRVLERRLGVDLVARSSRRVELTPAGQALLPEARTAVESVDRIRHVAQTQIRCVQGRLAIGSIGAEAQQPYTRAILAELRARNPDLKLDVCSLDIAHHVLALTQGEVDVAFLVSPMPPGIETLPLATWPRVACLPADDPLAGRTSVTLAELAGRPVVDVPPECPRTWWNFWAVDPRPDGTTVRYGPVVHDVEALFLAVAYGEAMAFLPGAARTFFPRPGVHYVEVSDASPGTAALAWMAKNRSLPTINAIRCAAATVLQRTPAPDSGR